MAPTCRLYTPPEYRVFDQSREHALVGALKKVTASTLVTEVSSVADLRLTPDGFLPDGYRYTSEGYRGVCTAVAKGLYVLTSDLAGVGRDAGTNRDEYSLAEAVRVYNRVLNYRFDVRDVVRKVRLLRNVDEKLVDGVLGPAYHLVDNLDVYERALDAAQSRPGCVFHEASLVGRSLVVRFRQRDPLFKVTTLAGREAFHGGLHFANSEVSGESSIKGAVVLYRASDSSSAMGRFLGGRRVHAGKNFRAKLSRVFGEAAASEQDAGRLAKGMAALSSASLGVGFDLPDDVDARVSSLASLLHEKGVPKTFANAVVRFAVYGTYDESPLRPSRSRLEARTAYDLYGALTAGARNLYATTRETLEQVAYQLLTGRFKLTK